MSIRRGRRIESSVIHIDPPVSPAGVGVSCEVSTVISSNLVVIELLSFVAWGVLLGGGDWVTAGPPRWG